MHATSVVHEQVAAYQLGQLLPLDQRPLPMALIRIADSSTDVVPNGGAPPTALQGRQ